MKISQRTDSSTMKAICGVPLKDRRAKYLMLTLGLNETIEKVAMANTIHSYPHELRKEDGGVLRTLNVDAKGQRKKESWQGHERSKF